MRLFLKIISVLILWQSPPASALTLLTPPAIHTPQSIFTDKQSHFYIVDGKTIWRFDGAFRHYATLPDKFEDFAASTYTVRLGGEGEIYAFSMGNKSTTTVINGKAVTTTISKLFLVTGCTPNCIVRNLSGKEFAAEQFVTSPQGDVFFALYDTQNPMEALVSKPQYQYFVNGSAIAKDEFSARYRAAYGLLLYPNLSDGFVLEGKDIAESIPHRLRGTRSVVWDSARRPHILFHDPATRSFHHHYFDTARNQLVHLDIDAQESGVENAAFADDDGLWVLHSYYRDNFNKGIAATRMDNDGKISDQFAIDASADLNIGWDLRAARAPNGKILLTYQHDTRTGARHYWLLDGAQDLRLMAQRLAVYGEVTQEHGDASPAQLEQGQLLTEGFNKNYKFFTFTAGTGAQYAFWNYSYKGPINYRIDNSIVNIIELGGQIRGVNFGLEYGKHLVDVSGANSAVSTVGSFIGWDRLLFDFDFKLSIEKSDTTVYMTDDSNHTYDRDYLQRYYAAKLILLTPRQTSFGVFYQQYNQIRLINKERILQGSTHWNLVASGLGDVDVKIFAAHAGYSTADYLLKFETQSRQFYTDAYGIIGAKFQTLRGNSVSAWGATPDIRKGLVMGGGLEYGYLWYKRWNTRLNVGGLIKLAYRIDLQYMADGAGHEDEDKAVDSDRTEYYTDNGYTLRHGPVAYAILVF